MFSLERNTYQDRKIAVYFKNEAYTYHELKQAVQKRTTSLNNIGIKKGNLVGIAFEKSPDMIVTMLALIEINTCFLPIDINCTRSHLDYLISDSQLNIILASKEQANKISHFLDDKQVALVDVTAIGNNAQAKKIRAVNNDCAYVMYTSGSTGSPKGVVVKRQSMIDLFCELKTSLNVTSDDIFLGLTSYTFDVSLIELIMPFYIGATLCLAEDSTILNANKIKKILTAHSITLMQATPITWRELLAAGWRNNNSNMKVLCGGDIFSTQLAASLNYYLGNVWNMYGPTETTMWSSIYNLEANDDLQNGVSIGNPIQGETFYILDENLEEIENNNDGELYIGGVGLAEGYLGNEKLTQERFIETKYGRLYKTGDIVIKKPNGELLYVGRVDSQIKINGVRVDLSEIEQLFEQHSEVEDYLLIADQILGEQKALLMYIKQSSNCRVSENLIDELRTLVSTHLPIYMHPWDYKIVKKWPLTTNAKIDKQALLNEYRACSIRRGMSYEDAKENFERVLNTLLADSVKPNLKKSIVDYGIQSSHLPKFKYLIDSTYGISYSLHDFYEHPTLEALLKEICLLMQRRDEQESSSPELLKVRENVSKDVMQS